MRSHINPEIVAEILEEVQGQILAVRQGVCILKDNPSEFAAFEEVHRLLFSIKTSAMLAGLTSLSQIAHYQAVALEEIASGMLDWTPLTTAAFNTAIRQMEAYISAVSLGDVDDRAILGELVSAFRRMRTLTEEGLNEEIDGLETSDTNRCELPSVPSDQGWEFEGLPEDLIETFRQEAREHLASIGGWLKNERPILADIRRSVHTLKGAAASVGLRQLSALANRMEQLLDQNNGEHPGKLFLETLDALTELSSGKEYTSDLQAKVELLHARYEDFTGSFTAATEAWNADSLSPDLAEIFHEEAAELLAEAGLAFRELASGPVNNDKLKNARRPIHTLKGAAGSVGLQQPSLLAKRLQFLLDGMEDDEIETSASNLALLHETYPVLCELCDENNRGVELRQKVEKLHARFDAVARRSPDAIPSDIADIFRTEAEELLLRIGESLKVFEATQGDEKPLNDLRRDVHTLKGAAASAGFRELERLAHRMEDLFDALGAATAPPVVEVHELLRDTIDAMAMMASGADSETIASLYPRYSNALSTLAPRLLNDGRQVPEPRPAPAELAAPLGLRKKSGLTVRVPIERLDELVRMIGELAVNRSTFEQQLAAYAKEVGELQLSLARLKRISSHLDSDFEVNSFQIGFGQLAVRAVHAPTLVKDGREEFDPLEFDRYTDFHLVSRELNETSSDIHTAASELSYRIPHFDSYLDRLGTLTSEIQDKIMRIRMVPLKSIAARLDRTARATCERNGKLAALTLEGGQIELDKTVIEEMAGPLDHIVRNAVDHGIEDSESRRLAGKPEQGLVRVHAYNQGTQIVIEVSDDGGGLRQDKLRETALRRGIHTLAQLDGMTVEDLHNLIFHPGFSTARDVSEISGRGVGMDVVKTAVDKLRGTIAIESEPGLGTKFIIRLPMTLAIIRVLMVRSSGELLAIPLTSIHKVLRVDREEVGQVYHLGDVLGLAGAPARSLARVPILVFNFDGNPVSIAVDQLMEAREVVVKSLGDMLRRVPGISGATLMGDGSVVLIVEPADIVRMARGKPAKKQQQAFAATKKQGYDVMVVDDSVSVRRVLSNLITSNGWTPTIAKDGVEALEILRNRGSAPDVILLDIEMPRMDGYDLTGILRNEAAFKHVPIIMLTSRSGDKHRRKAFELGATDYLVKPYQEETLLTAIRKVVRGAKPVNVSTL